MSRVAIIDIGIGNIGSLANIIRKIGHEPFLIQIADDLEMYDRIILPGVGKFDAGMEILEAKKFDIMLKKLAKENRLIMGICLGMQLLFDCSEEGEKKGLGLISGNVKKFKFNDNTKVPHMGWNTITIEKKSLLTDSFVNNENRFYFVHSYHCCPKKEENILLSTFYGEKFVSAVHDNNILGVQFHPEKSHKFGMELLKNFMEKICYKPE